MPSFTIIKNAEIKFSKETNKKNLTIGKCRRILVAQFSVVKVKHWQ